MYKLTIEFKTKDEIQAFLGTQPTDLKAPVALTAAPVEKDKPSAEVVSASTEAKKKRQGTVKPKAEKEPTPIVEDQEEVEEVESVEIDREAVLTEAREVCGALISSSAGNEAGAVKARILNIIKSHGGDGKMSSIIDDEKLMDALQDLKKFAVEKLDKDESFV